MRYRRTSQVDYYRDRINLDNGLTALWSGNGGLTDIDRTGKGQDGTISGGYDWVLGPDGRTRAVLLDGTNGRSVVVRKADANPFASRSFSICFWIWDISTTTKGVFDPGTNGSGGPTYAWLSAGPSIRFDISGRGFLTSTAFTVRQWTHFTLTWNDVTFVQTIYKNGVLTNQQTLAGGSTADFNAAGTWYWGSMGTTFYLNAAFGERRTYNRELTSSEAWLLAQPSFLSARLASRRVSKISSANTFKPCMLLLGVG